MEVKIEDPVVTVPIVPAVVSEKLLEPKSAKSTSNGINVPSTSDSAKDNSQDINQVNGSSVDRKVRFSDKVRVLRSISHLVSQSSESLKSHKHYKVHVENDKTNGHVSLSAVSESKDEGKGTIEAVRENGSSVENSTLPRTKKPRSKLFSSFRSKKKSTSNIQSLKDGKTVEETNGRKN